VNNLERGYRFLEAFVYPATLGAALAWWIQALATALDGSMPVPTTWALVFGFWFIGYHSTWYWFLITAEKGTNGIPKDYSRRSLVTDVLDTAAMMVGFGSLGFAAGNYDKTHAGLAFCAALALVVLAAIANYPRWSASQPRSIKFPVAFALAFIIPALGVCLNAGSGTAGELASWGPLLLLYGVLAAYIVRPVWFFSRRCPPA
jgi:hypothetical protein